MVRILRFMDKRGDEIFGSWSLFLIFFTLLFLLNVGLAAIVTQAGFVIEDDFNEAEGSVLGVNILNCLGDNIGVVERERFEEGYLINCYDYREKFEVELSLISVQPGLDGEAIQIGQLGVAFTKKYYVTVDNEPYLLEVRWKRVI